MFSHIINLFILFFYFIKSNVKTTIPVLVVMAMVVPNPSLSQSLRAFFWTWLELIEFDTSNQTAGNAPEEDARNKPDRPIPSGKITLKNALLLRYTMPFINFGFSAYCGTGALVCSTSLTIFTFLHNEMKGANHWFTKNFLNSILTACFAFGATSVLGPPLSDFTRDQWIACTGFSVIIMFAAQAQDFKDVEGDKLQGRQTAAIAYPNASRAIMPLPILATSGILVVESAVSSWLKAILCVLGSIVSLRYFFLRTEKGDQRSYLIFNIWLCVSLVCLGRLAPGAFQYDALRYYNLVL